MTYGALGLFVKRIAMLTLPRELPECVGLQQIFTTCAIKIISL